MTIAYHELLDQVVQELRRNPFVGMASISWPKADHDHGQVTLNMKNAGYVVTIDEQRRVHDVHTNHGNQALAKELRKKVEDFLGLPDQGVFDNYDAGPVTIQPPQRPRHNLGPRRLVQNGKTIGWLYYGQYAGWSPHLNYVDDSGALAARTTQQNFKNLTKARRVIEKEQGLRTPTQAWEDEAPARAARVKVQEERKTAALARKKAVIQELAGYLLAGGADRQYTRNVVARYVGSDYWTRQLLDLDQLPELENTHPPK